MDFFPLDKWIDNISAYFYKDLDYFENELIKLNEETQKYYNDL